MQANRKLLGKWTEVFVLAGLALILAFAVWQVFVKEEKQVSKGITTEEAKLIALLETIDGVGEVEVMISSNESGERGAVIVCDGGMNFSVVIDVREAAATALGIAEKNIKVYLKNQ